MAGHHRRAQANRSFLRRVVTALCQRGVDQFLDLGSGIPTVGNVHEIAHRHNPTARVAYVDHESVAVAHARRLLDGDARVSVTQADIRDPVSVLNAPGVAGLLDFTRPVAVLALAILHFLPDDTEVTTMLRAYRAACIPGGYLALSHGTRATLSETEIRKFLEAYQRTVTPAVFRTREQIAGFTAGYELLHPGLVLLQQWRPENPVSNEEAERINCYGAVGMLPDVTPNQAQ